MSPRFPLLYLRRLAGLLLLITLMFHAAAPVGAPLDRQRGSAFSSATEVTLKARAKAVAAEATVALEPPAPPDRFARQATAVLAEGPGRRSAPARRPGRGTASSAVITASIGCRCSTPLPA